MTTKPDLSLYRGKRVIAITRGELPHEWGIKLQGDVEIRNKDDRETMAPIGLVGAHISSLSLSLHDTTIHFDNGEKFSFNPVKYVIYDPAYGSEVLPQWPEELELAGNVPEGMEPSGEPTDADGWALERSRLARERDETTRREMEDFMREDK